VSFNISEALAYQRGLWGNASGVVDQSEALNTTAPSTDGEFWYNYTVKDLAGVWYNRSMIFIIDATAPTALFVNVAINSTHVHTLVVGAENRTILSQNLRIAFIDDRFSQAAVNVYYNGTFVTSMTLTGNGSFYFLNNTPGTTRFVFTMNDTAGNIATAFSDITLLVLLPFPPAQDLVEPILLLAGGVLLATYVVAAVAKRSLLTPIRWTTNMAADLLHSIGKSPRGKKKDDQP
jgi:hypothetical protein